MTYYGGRTDAYTTTTSSTFEWGSTILPYTATISWQQMTDTYSEYKKQTNSVYGKMAQSSGRLHKVIDNWQKELEVSI